MSKVVLRSRVVQLQPPEVRPERASETDLAYRFLLGDVIFRVADVDLSAVWGWIPLLDFTRQVAGVAHALARGVPRRIDFTESEATIDFDPDKTAVVVHASYARGLASASADDLNEAAWSFVDLMIDLVDAEIPGLRASVAYKSWLNDIEVLRS